MNAKEENKVVRNKLSLNFKPHDKGVPSESYSPWSRYNDCKGGDEVVVYFPYGPNFYKLATNGGPLTRGIS